MDYTDYAVFYTALRQNPCNPCLINKLYYNMKSIFREPSGTCQGS